MFVMFVADLQMHILEDSCLSTAESFHISQFQLAILLCVHAVQMFLIVG